MYPFETPDMKEVTSYSTADRFTGRSRHDPKPENRYGGKVKNEGPVISYGTATLAKETQTMPRKGRSNEEIIHALHQVEGGEKVTEACRRLGVSEQTLYRWKEQFAGLGVSELRELRSL